MNECIDLKYGDTLISAYNGVLGSYDNSFFEEGDSLGVYESVSTMSRLSTRKKSHGGHYTDTLKRELSIGFVPAIDHDTYAEFQEKFFNSKSYKKMIYIDNEDRNTCYYMAKLINPKYKKLGNQFAEVTVDVEYDSPYAYMEDDFSIEYTAKGTYIINNTSHDDERVYPNITLKGTGQITLENTTNGSKFIITLSTDETVTLNSNLWLSTDDATKAFKLADCDMVNGNFVYISKGNNSITVGGTGTLNKIGISFPICKKVGV